MSSLEINLINSQQYYKKYPICKEKHQCRKYNDLSRQKPITCIRPSIQKDIELKKNNNEGDFISPINSVLKLTRRYNQNKSTSKSKNIPTI